MGSEKDYETLKNFMASDNWWRGFNATVSGTFQEESKKSKTWTETKCPISNAVTIIMHKDLPKRERLLTFITTSEYGMANLLKALEVGLITPASDKLSRILRESVNPRNHTYRVAALSQLQNFNSIGLIVSLLEGLGRAINKKDSKEDEELLSIWKRSLVNLIWLFSAVACKDPKFPSKIRVLSKVKFMHGLIKKNLTRENSSTHYPLLKILRMLSKNPKVSSTLGRDELMKTMNKIFGILQHIPSPKLSILFDTLVFITKDKLNCKRLLKAGLHLSIARSFHNWGQWKGRGLLKFCRSVISIYANIASTNSGRKVLRQTEALTQLRRFCEIAPNDKHFDVLIMRISSLNSLCFNAHKLPLLNPMNPITFDIPKLGESPEEEGGGKLGKESGTSSDEDDPENSDVGEEVSECSDSDAAVEVDGDDEELQGSLEDLTETESGENVANNSDEEDLNADDEGEVRLEISEDHMPREMSPLSIESLQNGPVLLSSILSRTSFEVKNEAKSLEEYCKFFRELSEFKILNGDSGTSTQDHSLIQGLLNGSVSEGDLLKGIQLPFKNNSEAPESNPSPQKISKLYLLLANSINHVSPFVKVAYPDLIGATSISKVEPLTTYLERSIMRKKIVASMGRIAGEDAFKPRVVFDLDTLISRRESLNGKINGLETPKFLGNNDEKEVGVVDRKRDYLKFESRFESGNLRKAIQVGDREYDLFINPDINSDRHNQWFYFQVSNISDESPYTFNIVNCVKGNSQFNFGMQPVFFSLEGWMSRREGWTRSGFNCCYFKNGYKNLSGKRRKKSCHFTTSFSLKLQRGDICYIAYHYPYTYTRLLTEIWKLFKMASNSPLANNVLRRYDILCRTLNNNEVPLLTITAKDSIHHPIQDRKIIILTSRVHPGESNASWIMSGILHKLLLNSNGGNERLLQKYIFKIIPMLNIEGVVNGCHRCGLSNQDLNRQWSLPNMILHPSIYHAKALIDYSCTVLRKVPFIFCDLHGHSRKKSVFFYGCSLANSWCANDRILPEDPNIVRGLPEAMGRKSRVFELNNCNFEVKKSRESTGRVALWREYGIARSYTLEASYCGCDKGEFEGMSIGTNQLMEVGEKLCEAILELTNPTPTEPIILEKSSENKILESDSMESILSLEDTSWSEYDDNLDSSDDAEEWTINESDTDT